MEQTAKKFSISTNLFDLFNWLEANYKITINSLGDHPAKVQAKAYTLKISRNVFYKDGHFNKGNCEN